MAYKIDEKCIDCGMCAGECPVEAIKPGKGAHVINDKICVDCGSCESVCPVQAISPKK